MQIHSNVYVGIKPSPRQQRMLSQGAASRAAKGDTAVEPTETSIESLSESCDYVLLAITNSRYQERVHKYVERYVHRADPFEELLVPEPHLQDLLISPFSSADTASEAATAIGTTPPPKANTPANIGLLASWVDLESSDLIKREMSMQVLLNECKLAKNIGVTQVILAPPRDISNLKLYAQMVARLLTCELFNSEDSQMVLSVSLPMYEDSDALATWDLWNTLRRLCDYHQALMVSLAFPRTKVPNHVVVRWLAEPVSCLLLSSSIFVTNQYDYPVLHKFNQALIQRFQQVNGNAQIKSNALVIIMHGIEKYRDIVQGGELAYLEYINFLLKRNDKQALSSGSHRIFQNPQLMVPLTPHSDDLSNEVYSVFERDATKYELYGKAIRAALMDLASMQGRKVLEPLTVLVAGAGRGPLVTQVFNAARELKMGSHVRILALEKNPQAFLYLQKLNSDQWNSSVTLLQEDMRKWRADGEKVDLCVSELLGSFGCNELSPECLWNIESHHSKPHTIFIPQSYTSYVAPVTSPLLFQKLSLESRRAPGNGSTHYLEQPWVMHCLPHSVMSTRVNELWTFAHPSLPKGNPHDVFNRSVTTEFKLKHRGEVHGLAGYFTAHLYAEYTLSTLPVNTYVEGPTGLSERRGPTPGLHSWSPFVMPLREPLVVTDDTEVSVMCSRQMDPQRVWYEWAVESYVYLEVSVPREDKQGEADTREREQEREDTAHSTGTDHTRRREFTSVIAAESTGILPGVENGWQSVHDVHGQGELKSAPQEPLPELDMHVRVNTGVSTLHNCDGVHFNIPL
ncbi:protein arginine N-methyltransferase [Maudiozyma humilis]|uniref:Protein arginine N-methyltransferase n=1 Tax=Maudiozyma humilis TaxID=51915 RepID=A0AAV5RSS4_MAUHU|nr:protein arginine N-methyltransferase [Kazachstania humilis]